MAVQPCEVGVKFWELISCWQNQTVKQKTMSKYENFRMGFIFYIRLIFLYLVILFYSTDCFHSEGGRVIYCFYFARCVQSRCGSLGPGQTQPGLKVSCTETWWRKPSGCKCVLVWALFRRVRWEALRDTFPQTRGYWTCWGQSRSCPLFF